MSYGMYIGDDEFNYTYNVSGMWYAAIPETGIRSHYGMTGKEAITPLLKIYGYMVLHRDELLEFEPDNKWGDFDGAMGFVHNLIRASLRNPEEKWEGD